MRNYCGIIAQFLQLIAEASDPAVDRETAHRTRSRPLKAASGPAYCGLLRLIAAIEGRIPASLNSRKPPAPPDDS